MTAKEKLRQLVERLSEPEAETALDLIESEFEDPMIKALDEAPLDDEPVTPEEQKAVDEAWEEYQSGKTFSAEEVKRELL